jgi:hypothetical protein
MLQLAGVVRDGDDFGGDADRFDAAVSSNKVVGSIVNDEASGDDVVLVRHPGAGEEGNIGDKRRRKNIFLNYESFQL